MRSNTGQGRGNRLSSSSSSVQAGSDSSMDSMLLNSLELGEGKKSSPDFSNESKSHKIDRIRTGTQIEDSNKEYSREELEQLASRFMDIDDINTKTTKELRQLISNYEERMANENERYLGRSINRDNREPDRGISRDNRELDKGISRDNRESEFGEPYKKHLHSLSSPVTSPRSFNEPLSPKDSKFADQSDMTGRDERDWWRELGGLLPLNAHESMTKLNDVSSPFSSPPSSPHSLSSFSSPPSSPHSLSSPHSSSPLSSSVPSPRTISASLPAVKKISPIQDKVERYIQDKSRTEQDKGRMEQDRVERHIQDKVERHLGRTEQDKGRTEQDKGRTEQDKGRAEQEKSRADLDLERIRAESKSMESKNYNLFSGSNMSNSFGHGRSILTPSIEPDIIRSVAKDSGKIESNSSNATSRALSMTISSPDKSKALQGIIEELQRQFGDCNEKIKKIIEHINTVYAPSHQKIINMVFSAEEREKFYKTAQPTYDELYKQLYGCVLEVYQQRQAMITQLHQNTLLPKRLFDYLEERQKNLSDLLVKYKTLLEL